MIFQKFLKKIYSNFIKNQTKNILSTNLFSFLFSRFFYLSLRRLSKDKINGKRIVIFHEVRCKEDVEVYLSHPRLVLFSAPIFLLEIVEAIFFDRSVRYHDYFNITDKKIIESRQRKRKFLEKTILYLKKKKIDAIVTPSVQYRLDQDWAFVSNQLNLNFICLHKEFTVMDKNIYKKKIIRFKKDNLKFLGSKLLVSNKLGKKLFIETKFCEKSRVKVIGSLRMDRILPVKENEKKKGDSITLFSFGHLSGGIGFDDLPEAVRHKYEKYHYFSNENYGFVKLFNNVHSISAECALKNPRKKFIIKIKNINDFTWKSQISRTIEQSLKIKFNDIKNISFSDRQAPDLIKLSEVVIGFNSTVLLEAIILNTKTIIPVFDEAKNRFKNNIYYKDYFSLFKIAKSKSHLQDLISYGFDYNINKSQQKKMIEEFLGFSDGKTLERFFFSV